MSNPGDQQIPNLAPEPKSFHQRVRRLGKNVAGKSIHTLAGELARRANKTEEFHPQISKIFTDFQGLGPQTSNLSGGREAHGFIRAMNYGNPRNKFRGFGMKKTEWGTTDESIGKQSGQSYMDIRGMD
jgi:hypothetical protein